MIELKSRQKDESKVLDARNVLVSKHQLLTTKISALDRLLANPYATDEQLGKEIDKTQALQAPSQSQTQQKGLVPRGQIQVSVDNEIVR